jgi:alpha-glucosidase
LALPLNFLGDGRYTAKIWKDAPDVDSDPNRLAIETLNLAASDTLKIHVAVDGGCVAQLAPSKQ